MEDESGTGFSCSIGIEQTYKQPEIIVTGLDSKISQWIINEYNNRIREGEVFVPKEMYSGFLDGFNVQFRTMSRRHYKNYLGWGLWLYEGEDFRVNQMIWPSTKGVWPWDKNAPDDLPFFIPFCLKWISLTELNSVRYGLEPVVRQNQRSKVSTSA